MHLHADTQGLYEQYKNKKFQVLGFPCNQFGSQEPGSNAGETVGRVVCYKVFLNAFKCISIV